MKIAVTGGKGGTGKSMVATSLAVELPCTGGPCIFILGLLAERTTQMMAVPILLIYNLFFIFPLLLITLLVFAGFTSVEGTSKWKDRNIRKLHLFAGIVMLILGIIVISGAV